MEREKRKRDFETESCGEDQMESGLISVDRWKSGSQAYFLTHMHSDHTRGLSALWSHAPLFCSRTTASLFPSRFPGFDLSLLRVVPLSSSWQSLSLLSPSSGSPVLLHFLAVDAHHCPGSVMFMFRGDFGTFLYTGDFRWECGDAAEEAEEARNTLVAAVNDFPVDILYLDNTYCNPIYTFPSRQVAANLIADIILSHPSHDIVIGIDSLGKEQLLLHISRILNIKIWVWPERLRTMHLLGFHDIFTTDTSLTRVRAVPRYSFSIQTLEGLNLTCPTIGIMPSGLPWLKRPFEGDGNLSGSLFTATTCRKTAAQQRELLLQGAVHMFHDNMYSVHYSDHSCYEEIGEFVKLVKPKTMKGIVASSSCYVDPLYYFGRVCGVSQPPELLLSRPDTTREQFRAVRIKSYSTKDETTVAKKGKWREGDGHSSLKRNKKRRARIQVKCAKIAEVD